VGGGYPEAESGLSKIALQWMLNEAINAGLLVSPGRMDLVLRKTGAYAAPDANAMMHESLTRLWWLAEILWKRRYNWMKRQYRRRAISDAGAQFLLARSSMSRLTNVVATMRNAT
jgi:hypothetical protein